MKRYLHKFSSLDYTAWAVMAGLLALIGLVIGAGNQVGISAELEAAGQGAVGPLGPLKLHFSRPVALEALTPLVQVSPQISGSLLMQDALTVQFIPQTPFQPQVTYSLTLAAGVAGVGGERVKRAQIWSFSVRDPLVVYVAQLEDSRRDLWTVGLDGGEPQRLTYTNGLLFDYAAAPDGEWVAYSALNDQRGIDLWLVSRDGSSARLLVNCAGDRCSTPVWSPDSRWLAYSRQAAGMQPGEPHGVLRPWLVQVASGLTRTVFNDSQIIGFGASWSPDGRWLASFDGIQGGIRLLDVQTVETIFLESNTGTLPAWSPDSRYLFYTNSEAIPGGPLFQTIIYRADPRSGETEAYLGKGLE